MRVSRRSSLIPLGVLIAILILTVSAPAAAAAGTQPNARFEFAQSGLAATFTDTSEGEPTAWAWEFGDDTTSAVQNPTHTYAPGTYTVRLTVTNDAGTDHASHKITVKTPPPDKSYSLNLYSPLVRYQNPDVTACVATSTMIMLNEIAAHGRKGKDFIWSPSVAAIRQRRVLIWARGHDTLKAGPGGTDPNGWRNALNEYGWGDYQDPAKMNYKVASSRSFTFTVKTAIMAMARYHRPVGLLGWAGGHAQVLNGYVVYGQDPALSSAFTVQYVYLTDPLRRDALRNARISYAGLFRGPLKYRFRRYLQSDSPVDDPYVPGIVAADVAWYGRYVIVMPVR